MTDGLNQYKGCLSSTFGECEIFDGLTNALKRIKELEAERDKWKKRTEELLAECDRLNKESSESDSDFIDLVAERDQWKARAIALERAANGYCVMCTKAEPMKLSSIVTCEKMRERGVIGRSGRTVCEHWQFDQTRFADVTPEAEAAE